MAPVCYVRIELRNDDSESAVLVTRTSLNSLVTEIKLDEA